ATTTTVPFKLSANHIFVRGTVDGKTFAFVFDTAGGASLTQSARKALGLAAIGQAEIPGIGNAPEMMDIVQPKVASIGDATVKDGYFIVLPSDMGIVSPFEGVPLGGVLGREFFAGLPVTIDYTNDTLTFTNPASFHPDPGANGLPITMRDGIFPNVRASVDGATGSFDLDAGSASSLMLSQSFASANGIEAKMPRTANVVAGRGVGGAISGVAGRVATFSLGDVSIPDVVAYITNATGGAMATPGLAGNIGGEILRRFTVTIDVPDKMVYLAKNATFGEPFAFSRTGLSLDAVDGKVVVAHVIADSPAQAAGVHEGDVLVAIDGKSTASLSSDELKASSLQAPGTVVRIEIRRDGKPLSFALKLRDLL
ncbi:MAG TPA: aspartyl protease family protein, partial [Candidatus Acidoferrales bacterium]|nr:aspartyl protease family protein [Candidatus Acidoferrales bacterium]